MQSSITLPTQEYEELVRKATLFDHYLETEELTDEELRLIEEAMKGPFLTKAEFLKRHPELS